MGGAVTALGGASAKQPGTVTVQSTFGGIYFYFSASLMNKKKIEQSKGTLK